MCQTINSVSIIENNKTRPIEIYPNPFSGELTIELDNYYDDVEVTLNSISGQLISKQLYKNTRNISFEINQRSGLFIIETKIESNFNSSLIQLLNNNIDLYYSHSIVAGGLELMS